MFLNDEIFRKVIASTPLVSIDIIVRDMTGLVLLGERINSPAKGYWFVPGGRIYKNETIAVALSRISFSEIGMTISLEHCKSLGVYEHFYTEGFYGEADSTHYVVLSFEIITTPEKLSLPKSQHTAYKWLCETEILKANDVHKYTKQYFSKGVA